MRTKALCGGVVRLPCAQGLCACMVRRGGSEGVCVDCGVRCPGCFCAGGGSEGVCGGCFLSISWRV